MHLSLLSDGYFSDAINDAGRSAATSAARAHRDGLVRGLVCIGVAALLIGLTMASPVRPAEADTRCKPANADAPQAAVWWEASPGLTRSVGGARSFRAVAEPGTSVSLVALRQRFRSACR